MTRIDSLLSPSVEETEQALVDAEPWRLVKCETCGAEAVYDGPEGTRADCTGTDEDPHPRAWMQSRVVDGQP